MIAVYKEYFQVQKWMGHEWQIVSEHLFRDDADVIGNDLVRRGFEAKILVFDHTPAIPAPPPPGTAQGATVDGSELFE